MFFRSHLDIMDERKVEINIQWREVKAHMKAFTVKDLKAYNRKVRYPVVSKEVGTLLVNLLILHEELFDTIVDKDGDEMKAEQEQCIPQEGEIKEFLSNLEDRYYDLEEEASTDEASAPATDKSVASLEQAMKEQLEDSKRREEEEKRARQEKERITEDI